VLAAVLKRLGELAFVCAGVSVLTFLMIRLIPGDAVQIMLGANAEVTPAQIATMRARLGLDQPIFVQYAHWIGRALHGDLGTSVWTGRPVLEEILPRVGVTAELTLLALLLAAILAIPLGCLMATARRRWADYTIRVLSIVGITTPSFWLGVMLLYAISVAAPDAQMLGWVSFADDPLGNLQHVILPVTALALPVLASLARVVRASMVEVMRQDYIRTARAKGLPERDVIIVHALRNALLPFLTNFGIMAGYLFGGSVVIEQVFALPGLGRLMVGAIAERNYPLVQASICSQHSHSWS
jgi:peptide/nickel transport system permease protein